MEPKTMSSSLFIVAGGCIAAASLPVTAATSFGRREPKLRTSFVHHAHPRQGHAPTWQKSPVPLRRVVNPLVLHAADHESIDPFDLYDEPRPPSSSSSWGVGDDWSELTSDNTGAAAFASPSSAGQNYNVMEDAARILEDQEQIVSEWDASDDDGDSSSKESKTFVKSEGDDFADNAVDLIASNGDYYEPDGVQLYDTISSASPSTEEKSQIKQEEEIAFMVRCNQSPEQLLISQGKALPELTNEEKYSASFLLEEQSLEGADVLPLQPQQTAFFEDAVKEMFDTYSIQVEEAQVMDREAISKWMTKCIASSLATSKQYTIGPYDQSVSASLSRYSQTHGSGRLTLEEFQGLYLEVAWAGYVRDIIKKKTVLDVDGEGRSYHMPSANEGVTIQGKKNTEKMLRQASVSLIWRDLEAHGIFSPVEEERVQHLLELERLQATLIATTTGKHSQLLMDECVLFDEYEDRLSHQSYSDENDNDMLGEERNWDFLKERKEKSSFKSVEMASDGKTPKRIRDGKFVFIDEESCIGCTQCAQIAPSTFKMIEDTGRARTYYQSNSEDVENAVMACPVDCMHSMSFDELKEMEEARDDGDGRTDHQHFGRGRTHTALHVAGIDSDANHKSSWYHYLKWKCHGSSCPQRGCYDCPQYAPGENPFFKERHMQAELIRAKDFMESGEADKWRKVMEL